MAFELSDLKEHNSELLNLLTQHLPDMLWVKDVEGTYIYANKALCEGLLMANDTEEPIGKNDVFFALREREAHKHQPSWHTFGELCFNSDIDVIKNNQAMKFEEYGNVKGKLMYLEVYKAPFYDKEGNIIGTVGAGRDITQMKKSQFDLQNSLSMLEQQRKQLEYQANHDALTGLPNRVLFMDRLTQILNVAQKYDEEIAVLFIDLDHFKEINDSLGHDIGDQILVEFTKRVETKIEITDTLSRLGGDEFCVILSDISEPDYISNIISEIVAVVKESFVVGNNTLYVGMSIGIVIYPHDGEDAHALLKNADAAMYKAKENGRNRYCFYDENMTAKAYERVFLEAELRKAFINDELVVYFQPQMDIRTDRLVGMEALVRWQHPTMGLISPVRFIPLAELSGMIVELDRIVMQKALSEFAKWEVKGLNPGRLSMNLAMKQIEENDFIAFIKQLALKENIAYELLGFEVTESQIMKNPKDSIEALQKINDLGICLSVDDFGTGYSSLAYLKRLPIKKLKIDKSFIDNLPHDAEDAAISKTIISLAENLNLKVIAEGVETQEQKKFLYDNGCYFVQGYVYSQPLAPEAMEAFLIEKLDNHPL
ncbi:MAG: EAL domain-containing protein [Sulfurimonas sp.]